MVGDIASSFGIPYRYEVRMHILGTTEPMTAKIAVNELQLPISVEEFMVRYINLGRERLLHVDLMKGLIYTLFPIINYNYNQKTLNCINNKKMSDLQALNVSFDICMLRMFHLRWLPVPARNWVC